MHAELIRYFYYNDISYLYNEIGKIRAKIHEIGKIKAIFRLGMTPIKGHKNGQIKSLSDNTVKKRLL